MLVIYFVKVITTNDKMSMTKFSLIAFLKSYSKCITDFLTTEIVEQPNNLKKKPSVQKLKHHDERGTWC